MTVEFTVARLATHPLFKEECLLFTARPEVLRKDRPELGVVLYPIVELYDEAFNGRTSANALEESFLCIGWWFGDLTGKGLIV